MKSIEFVAIPAVLAAALVGLAACGGTSGSGANVGSGSSSGTRVNQAPWTAACAQTASNTFTVSDENGNQATVTDCGYQVGGTANGRPAAAGNVFISTVFKLTADQAASFDTINGTYKHLYTGNRDDCTAATNSADCPQLGTGGDAYAMDASGKVDTATSGRNANFKPLFQDAAQYQVVTTQVAEPASNGKVVVVYQNDAMSTGNFTTYMISAVRQNLPLTWGG